MCYDRVKVPDRRVKSGSKCDFLPGTGKKTKTQTTPMHRPALIARPPRRRVEASARVRRRHVLQWARARPPRGGGSPPPHIEGRGRPTTDQHRPASSDHKTPSSPNGGSRTRGHPHPRDTSWPPRPIDRWAFDGGGSSSLRRHCRRHLSATASTITVPARVQGRQPWNRGAVSP